MLWPRAIEVIKQKKDSTKYSVEYICIYQSYELQRGFESQTSESKRHLSPPTVVASAIHLHDDVIQWKHFPRYWPFVRGIHRSPVNSPHKGQWRRALMFSLICACNNVWVNNDKAGDLRRYRSHYGVTVMRSRPTNQKLIGPSWTVSSNGHDSEPIRTDVAFRYFCMIFLYDGVTALDHQRENTQWRSVSQQFCNQRRWCSG